jgi:hypothetical protein
VSNIICKGTSIVYTDESKVQFFNTFNDFPIVGKANVLYIDKNITPGSVKNIMYLWVTNSYVAISSNSPLPTPTPTTTPTLTMTPTLTSTLTITPTQTLSNTPTNTPTLTTTSI